jgi:isopenicillin-N epimerase
LEARGVEVLLDSAHAPGMVPLDVRALGASYVTGNFHKWVCAPKGAAFLHVRRDRQAEMVPWVTSHGRNAPLGKHSRFRLEFEWTGTDDPSAWLSVPKAIEFVGDLGGGWDAVRAHNHELAVRGRDLLCATLGTAPPAPDAMLGSLASLPLPPARAARTLGAFDVDPLQKRLFDESRIEVPVHTWPTSPQRLVRISAQLYNTEDQYERLAAALARALESTH